jgi:hypothetical protein
MGRLVGRCVGVFHVEGELYLGNNFSFLDRGGNECGCPYANGTCEAVTTGYAPPQHIIRRRETWWCVQD